jgi:Ni,Fe-hydrogenase III large subunit
MDSHRESLPGVRFWYGSSIVGGWAILNSRMQTGGQEIGEMTHEEIEAIEDRLEAQK